MPPKEEKVLNEITKPKRERKALTISVKLDVIKRIEEGQRSRDICRAYHLSSSTVRTIYINKEKILKTAESVVGGAKLKTVLKARHPLYEELEKLLLQWIEDQTKRTITLSFLLIQQKAISLFEDLKKKAIEVGDKTAKDIEFKASHGWFDRFKKRGFLHSLRVTGEAATAYIQAASIFPIELAKIVKEGSYHPKQVFIINETGLFWKRIMSRTFISQEEKRATGHKASKDRLTLFLGGNLNGDVKLKPLLVYHTKNPRALKGINSLPVIWRSNEKAWLNQQVFFDYVQNDFCPFVEKYCRENDLSNKVLLIIDNAPGHPSSVVDYSDNVQVVFLPPKSSLLQTMDEGITSTFKACYMQLVMKYFVDGLDSSDKVSIRDLWKNYNIKMAVENIGIAWEKLSEKTMNDVWKKLLPEFVHDFEGFEAIEKNIKDDIVKLANKAGFDEVDIEDVQQVLESHAEELTNEELIQRDTECLDEQEDKQPKEMNTKALHQYFALIHNANSFLDQNDDNLERVQEVKSRISEAIQCYLDLYKRKVQEAKQSSILPFFRIVTASDPQPSTSGTSAMPKCDKPIKEEEEEVMDFSAVEVSYGPSSPLSSFTGWPSPRSASHSPACSPSYQPLPNPNQQWHVKREEEESETEQ